MNTLPRRALMGVGGAPINALKFTLTNDSQAGTISFNIPNGLTELQLKEIEISTNGKNWTKYENHGTALTITSPTLLAGESVYFRGVGLQTAKSTTVYSYFSSSQNVKFECEGNISYLIQNDNVVDYGFYGLFIACKGIVTAPELPATTLANNCYGRMFYGCTNLVNTPELPATSLIQNCYNGMFYGCTSLVNAPELPATTLANSCYRQMFYGCTSLTTAPELPATDIIEYSYYEMFRGCTSLTTAPELPATTIGRYCYANMFYGCTSLANAPELPATNLNEHCYEQMFYGCTSLANAPELPATTLANSCYFGMFGNCGNLTIAPELPATTLASYCYASMFEYCIKLINSPKLYAPVLAVYCYRNMFNGCTRLNKITMLATNISANNCLLTWVNNVAATGTFIKDPAMTTLPTGNNGIPAGWTVKDYVPDYVDLGLPSGLLWGTMNLGAENPEDDGLYYSWGNTEGHSADSGYNFSSNTYEQTTGGSIITNLTLEHDAANVLKGGNWRMPTYLEYKELFDETDSEWVANYEGTGINGIKFMKKSDHSIYVFIPASGYFNGTSRSNRGYQGYLWSSSMSTATNAYSLRFSSSETLPQKLESRRLGLTIRPVLSTQ